MDTEIMLWVPKETGLSGVKMKYTRLSSPFFVLNVYKSTITQHRLLFFLLIPPFPRLQVTLKHLEGRR